MAREATPAQKRRKMSLSELKVQRHCEKKGIPVPTDPNIDPETGLRTIFCEYNADRGDNIRLMNEYRKAGYEVVDEKENMRFKLTISPEKFEASQKAIWAKHAARTRREAKPEGKVGDGISEVDASLEDVQITDIEQLLGVAV